MLHRTFEIVSFDNFVDIREEINQKNKTTQIEQK